MGSVELLGVVDASDDPRYSTALRRTASLFPDAVKILEDPDTRARKDWKKKYEHKGDTCFNKHFAVGKCYTLRKEFAAPAEDIFRNHWEEIEKTPEWNPQVHSAHRHHIISETADIIHYATSDVVVVKGRDFVVCRMWRKVGDSWYVVASSFENDIPVMPKKKRGVVNVIAGRFCPLRNDPQRCTVDYLVSVDFPGTSIPKAVLSSNIAEMIVKEARYAEKYLAKMAGEKK